MNYLKVFFILFLSALMHINVLAQANSDSLKQLLAKDISDEERVNIYIDLSNNLSIENNIDRELYATKALDLSKKIKNDTLLISAFHNKADVLFRNKKYEEAIVHYNNSAEKCTELGDLKQIAYIYNDLGFAYSKISQGEKTQDYYSRALKLMQQLNDTIGIINSYYKIAKNFWDFGNLDSSKYYYLKVNELCKLSNNHKEMGSALNTLGTIFHRQGEYDSAVFYYKLAARNHLKYGKYSKATLVINNIGVVLMELNEENGALSKYKEGLSLSKQVAFTHGKAYSYVNIGYFYLKTNKLDLAKQYLDSALHEYELLDMPNGIVLCYRHIGDVYSQANQFDSAIKFHKLAVEKAISLGYKYDLAACYYNIAKTYSKFEKYDLANKNFELGLQISRANNYQNLIRNTYLGLAELFEVMGNYKESLVYYEKYTELRQEIYKNKGIQEFNDIVASYSNTKEKRAAEARETLNKTRITNLKYLIVAIVISLFLVVALYFRSYQRKALLLGSKKFLTQQNKEIIAQKEDLATKESVLREINNLLNIKTSRLEKNKAELQATIDELQKATDYKNKIFSIIGHDLKEPMGTVNKIISLIMDENLDVASRDLMLSLTQKSAISAYSLLENLLIWAKNEQGRIKYKPTKFKLITIVQEIVNMLQDRGKDKNVKIELAIDENVEVYADYNMVHTIIRNLTANAIKFSNTNGVVFISAIPVGQFIEISVKDQGIGISEKSLKQICDSNFHYTSKGTDGESGSGLGLHLCFDFIKTNKGEYKITSEVGKGAEFTFTLLAAEFCDK